MDAQAKNGKGIEENHKINVFQCYTKIQEAKPIYFSNLVNKELGYDSLVDMGSQREAEKIKNCICSARPNSQLFKRFSKNLISHIKNGINTLFLFCGNSSEARIQSSIGCQSNPGLFLIIALTFLDEKYKQSHQKCDVEFSFMEYREGLMYDLLCYTQIPLRPQRQILKNKFMGFGQHSVKTSTFNQFIKLFKIALFNNKERDFKNDGKSNRCKSTFIMKVAFNVYNDGQLVRHQETMLVDFDPNCVKQNTNSKQKSGKNIWDYVINQFHNVNPTHKPVRYHLVEENHLLLLLNKYLGDKGEENKGVWVNGQTIIVNSFSAQKSKIQQNLDYLKTILSAIGQSFQGKILGQNLPSKTLNQALLDSQLKQIAEGIQHKTYSSNRSFVSFKSNLFAEIKRCKNRIKELRRIILQFLRQKLELIYLKNQMTAYQINLIGGCIKSDHFKDFYNAKSYLQLEREINIKNETVKEEISNKNKKIEEIYRHFIIAKKKQQDLRNQNHIKEQNDKGMKENLSNTKSNWEMSTKTYSKFKKLPSLISSNQINYLQSLQNIIEQVYEYFYGIWQNVYLTSQRTVFDTAVLEQTILKEEQKILHLINNFATRITEIKESNVMYQQQNNIYNNNNVALFRSLNFLGLVGNKKTNKDHIEIGKRLMIVDQNKKVKSANMPSVHQKLPTISAKSIVINGDLKLSELLMNPYKSLKICDEQVAKELNLA